MRNSIGDMINRLTPVARGLILILLVGMSVIIIKLCSPPSIEEGDVKPQPQKEVEEPNPNNNKSDSTVFEYSAPQPVNGDLKGVVELGAKGFNSFIVEIDANKNWALKKADYGSSLLYENMTSDFEISMGLKNYISNMLAFGVNGTDIHFIISSGAQKKEISKKIIAELNRLRYVVNIVDAEKEGQLAYKCLMPSKYSKSAFIVDIGTGTTKIAWDDGDKIIGKVTYGAKYFDENITDQAAYESMYGIAQQVPYNRRKTCFIIGGVPFELANTHRNGKERFTVLKYPEEYAHEDDKRKKAGLNLYKAITDATGCKYFVFDWESNFAIGFLLEL